MLQLKVWLLHVSPMIWRRFQVPATFTLRQVHGVIQVGMGWEGIHLFQFCLRAAHYGSSDLCVDSPNITLAELQLRKGTRFLYEYDLNIPWCHEIRVDDKLQVEPGESYPRCIGGEGHNLVQKIGQATTPSSANDSPSGSRCNGANEEHTCFYRPAQELLTERSDLYSNAGIPAWPSPPPATRIRQSPPETPHFLMLSADRGPVRNVWSAVELQGKSV
jgi:hypothetical protein